MNTTIVVAVIVMFFQGTYKDKHGDVWEDAIIKSGNDYRIESYRKTPAYGIDSAGTVVETKDVLHHQYVSLCIDKGDYKEGDTITVDSITWVRLPIMSVENVVDEIQNNP